MRRKTVPLVVLWMAIAAATYYWESSSPEPVPWYQYLALAFIALVMSVGFVVDLGALFDASGRPTIRLRRVKSNKGSVKAVLEGDGDIHMDDIEADKDVTAKVGGSSSPKA